MIHIHDRYTKWSEREITHNSRVVPVRSRGGKILSKNCESEVLDDFGSDLHSQKSVHIYQPNKYIRWNLTPTLMVDSNLIYMASVQSWYSSSAFAVYEEMWPVMSLFVIHILFQFGKKAKILTNTSHTFAFST